MVASSGDAYGAKMSALRPRLKNVLSTPKKTAHGREVDCRRAMFLFTSNLEAGAILRELDSQSAFADLVAVDAVCRNWISAAGVAPELVGRMG